MVRPFKTMISRNDQNNSYQIDKGTLIVIAAIDLTERLSVTTNRTDMIGSPLSTLSFLILNVELLPSPSNRPQYLAAEPTFSLFPSQ
jgi:hypothetical protein